MAIYLVTYDLKSPGQDYNAVHEAIKSCGTWWHYLESVWLVDTSLNASQISATVRPRIDTNDSLLVVNIGSDYAGWLPKDAWDWIKQRSYALCR